MPQFDHAFDILDIFGNVCRETLGNDTAHLAPEAHDTIDAFHVNVAFVQINPRLVLQGGADLVTIDLLPHSLGALL